MARQNIDEEFWSDPRLDLLSAGISRAEAIGSCMILWRTGQMYWKKAQQLIPRSVFDTIPNAERLLNASFATVRADGVYVHGAEERWGYLTGEQQRAAGKKSAESRRKNFGTARPLNASRTDSNGRSENSNHTPPPTSSSSSSKIPFPSETGAALPAPAGDVVELNRGKNGVALWLEEYRRKYGVRYELKQQDLKQLNDLRKARTEIHTAALFAAYCAMDGPRELYAQAKHPLSLFFRDLASISVAAQTGVDHSKPALVSPEDLT